MENPFIKTEQEIENDQPEQQVVKTHIEAIEEEFNAESVKDEERRLFEGKELSNKGRRKVKALELISNMAA